jgi:lipoprotein-anchoring transpeptidase ErfK/SrfK
MSRFATSLLSTTGLLLVSLLAVVPTQLHAETKLPTDRVATPTPTNSLPATTVPTSVVKPSAVAVPAIPVTVPTSAVKPATPATTLPTAAVKPATGASTTAPSKPVTSTSVPAAGQKPTVKPTATAATSQPPAADLISLTLKLKERKVYVYKGDSVVAKYPVAIGKKGWETPTGDWYVMEKITNPGWTSFKNSSTVIGPGAKSPLGERWIGFWTDGQDMIGFHGTPDASSVGKAVSHGCVRMYDKDVKALFPLVKVGTTVKVVNE